MPLSIPLGALAEHDFRRYFVGQLSTQLGNRIAPLALAFAALSLPGADAATLGLLLAAQIVPQVLLLLLGGVVADRFDRRAIMIVADLTQFATQLATAVLFLTGAGTIWHIVLLQFAFGTASAFFNPASTGLVKQMVSAERLQQANSLLGLTKSLTGVVGPAIAAALFAVAPAAYGLLVNAATFLVSAAMLSLIRAVRGRAALSTTIRADLAEGWREFRSRRWLWVLVADASLYAGGVAAAFAVVGPVVSEHSLGGASAWALVLTARSGGAVVAGLLLLHWRPARPMLTGRLLLLADVPFLLCLALPTPVWSLAVLATASGAMQSGFGILWRTAMQTHVPDRVLSRVASYDWLGSLAVAPVGLVAVGLLSEHAGTRATLLGVVALHLATTIVVVRVRDVRALTSTPPEADVDGPGQDGAAPRTGAVRR
ncbi:MFS transporter [Micromonospora echinofusca]|uniref:MFS transporter n=1 Tax=Micromonospora echinofusca TaxID=47858 RepID=UPI003403FAD5